MNSKKPLQIISSEIDKIVTWIKKQGYKKVILAASALVVIIIIACVSTHKTQPTQTITDDKTDIAEQTQAASENDVAEIDPELVKRYESLQSEYNEAVDSYKTEVTEYNNTISGLEEYSTNLPTAIADLPTSLEDRPEEYLKKDPDLSLLNTNIQSLKEKTEALKTQTDEMSLSVLNTAINDYNILADAYNEILPLTALDFIENMPGEMEKKVLYNSLSEAVSDGELSSLTGLLSTLKEETGELAAAYVVANQITNPSQEFVIERLGMVSDITGIQAVTADKDPNGLLGKDGGYTACIYFTVDAADPDTVSGNDIVEKGTDGGGAIEVYETREIALNRCDYLSQFDNTLLYSGSYAVIGTMVVRTSYRLDNNSQCVLTDAITQALTSISIEE